MSLDIKLMNGEMGRQLARYVGKLDIDPTWTCIFVLKRPEDVISAYADFFRAGAKIIRTCTYRASIEGYCKFFKCDEEYAKKLIRKAGKLALMAKENYEQEYSILGANLAVVGSIGPYGDFVGFEHIPFSSNHATAEMIKEKHRDRINELMKDGITKFAFETIPSRREALIVVDLLREYPDITCWLSFVCSDETHLVSGENFEQTAIECYIMNPEQIFALGVDCVNPTFVSNLIRGINQGRTENDMIPLVVCPNSGVRYIAELGADYPNLLKPLHEYVDEWVTLGARYIGGCCQTDIEDMALIRKQLEDCRDP
ncbi:betaine-homocysteine S-methyltransferase-like [Arctopsyche grandis]|uniref:betaine-homocysteine S-methyltransferase-like n=1 Tax=Arctopsyche grandis TaxID=121162 RepID=UPI00406D63E4